MIKQTIDTLYILIQLIDQKKTRRIYITSVSNTVSYLCYFNY
jgi:hypothetical protein